MKLELTTKEKEFVSQYIDTALWAGNGIDYGLDEDCKREAIIDCLAFYSRFWDRVQSYSYSMGNYAGKFQEIAEGFGETDYYDTEGNTL